MTSTVSGIIIACACILHVCCILVHVHVLVRITQYACITNLQYIVIFIPAMMYYSCISILLLDKLKKLPELTIL